MPSGHRDDRRDGSRSDRQQHSASGGRRNNGSSSSSNRDSYSSQQQQRSGGVYAPRTDPSYASRMAANNLTVDAGGGGSVGGMGRIPAEEMFGSGLNPYGVNPPQGDATAYRGYREALNTGGG